MFFKAPRFAISLFFLGVATPGFAQSVPGWVAGPSSDATMQVGQRLDCEGSECRGGFACIHAAAPPRPAGARWLKTADVTSEKVWPWRSVETWLGIKLNEIAENPIVDPSLPVSEWASRDDPITFEIADEGFARRVYKPYSKERDLTVPIWFWTSKGRLFTMFCAIDGRRLSQVREPIHRLLSELHPGEPVRDDIPTHF